MITAHGKTYQTVAEAQARWDALEAENVEVGYSDGRVTEQNDIASAIAIWQAAEDEGMTTQEGPRFVVEKNEIEVPCEHPLCEQLHQRFMETETVSGLVNAGGAYTHQTWTERFHNKKRVEWVIVDTTTGQRAEGLDDVYDTKREAKAALTAHLNRH